VDTRGLANSEGKDEVHTPRFSDKMRSNEPMRWYQQRQTHLNSEYQHISKKVSKFLIVQLAYSGQSSHQQTPVINPPVTPQNDEVTMKDSSDCDVNSMQKLEANVALLNSDYTSQLKDKTLKSSENSENWYLRKRIQYNDNTLLKGGGGTGLLHSASDKSSSSKKFKPASSSSSGIKDLHAGQSANSSSDKSDQRHFDRLMRRNEITHDESPFHSYDLQNENEKLGERSINKIEQNI